ncbi:MAG: isoprenylcysteine carboxyl methyltransferase [Streptosporangiales bacterium]|nr:isoprenylcysteine carboxyl methyltransferase [Streptosporangiales bacterium]
MRRSHAAMGTALFFVVGPGTVLGLVPWWITGWEFREPLPNWWAAQTVGVLLIIAGLAPLVGAFIEFAKARGVPVPVTPTQHLVVDGFNRYVRNPMYVGLSTVVLGETLLFGRFELLWWVAFIVVITMTFVRFYEEPALKRLFGAEYEEYLRNVPGWIPRLRPWRPVDRVSGH